MMTAKKSTPRTTRTQALQFMTIQPTWSAMAIATTQALSVIKKAIDLRCPLTAMNPG